MILDALGPNGPYRAHRRLPIADVAGRPVAELSLVPPVFVTRAMSALRKAGTPPADALVKAGELFAADAAEHERMVSRVSGLPISVVRKATGTIATAAQMSYQSARPAGAVNDWRDPLTRTGRAVWTRRGDVLAVHAAGNHPAVHALWLEALALGYRVAVRPSQREPFTPHRLISALRAAGFGEDQVVLLPTDHRVAGEILRGADLGMVYGGDEVVRKYPNVLGLGPGRSKILLTADVDWRDHLVTIIDSIAGEAGTACVNATAVFVEGDAAPLAEAIAVRLAMLPSLLPEDEQAVLPVQPLAAARRLEKFLQDKAVGAQPWLDEVVDELGDGSAVLRPAVFEAAQAGPELPFPCVWVVPWSRAAGLGPLRGSLVVTAITRDEELVDALVAEPTISNVHLGDHPTHWAAPGVPHDGYLAEFLMRSKGVIRGDLPGRGSPPGSRPDSRA